MAGQKCVHKSRRTGLPCGNWAMKGQTQCRMHGGNRADKKHAASKRLVLKRAQSAVKLLGDDDVEPITDTATELSLLLGRVKVIEQVLWHRLNEHQDPATLDTYGDAVDRLGRFLTEATKLGLLDRQLAVQAAHANALSDVFMETIREQRAWLSMLLAERGVTSADAYHVTNDFERVSREKFAGHLRALPTESANGG